MNNKTIPVASPLLLPLEEFIPYLGKIWESRFLTNGDGICHALREALYEYLGMKHIMLFASATLTLITTLQTLRAAGEMITTPYSFVAANHALLWDGFKPIFVGIDRDFMSLDPSRIKAAVAPQTIAILPVRRYGNPCDVRAIQWIADIHHLKVVYDAAHTFAVCDAGDNVLRHGDLSIPSLHATKVLSTFESDAIICSNGNARQRLSHFKSFGFVGEATVVMPDINGKLSGVGVVFRLLQLKYVDQALKQRREIAEYYRRLPASAPGTRCLRPGTQTFANDAYSPALAEDGFPSSRSELYQRLRDRDVPVRYYFYPLISDFPMYHSLPLAMPTNPSVMRLISSQVLCPPTYPGLVVTDVEFVAGLIASVVIPRRRTSS